MKSSVSRAITMERKQHLEENFYLFALKEENYTWFSKIIPPRFLTEDKVKLARFIAKCRTKQITYLFTS